MALSFIRYLQLSQECPVSTLSESISTFSSSFVFSIANFSKHCCTLMKYVPPDPLPQFTKHQWYRYPTKHLHVS